MKALVINKPGELQVKDLPTPTIEADEVIVRMRAVGICHSDYELYSGKYIIPIEYPVTPGHEWSGEVVETGKTVSGIKPGDRVVGECVIELLRASVGIKLEIDAVYLVVVRGTMLRDVQRTVGGERETLRIAMTERIGARSERIAGRRLTIQRQSQDLAGNSVTILRD